MKNIEKTYALWLKAVKGSDLFELKKEGSSFEDIADAFYRDLAFGTGGLRGKLGMGPNRMNIYTVGKATQGLADYLNDRFENPSVALCRDSRNGGEAFVRRAAEVLAANGVTVHIFPRIEPTPALSFAVRDLGCSAGVNITASHNPAIYNGYKVYGSDGCQITVDAARKIQAAIDSTDIFEGVKSVQFEEGESAGLIQWIGNEKIDRYSEAVLSQSMGVDCSNLSVVYTPLNGTGLECVSRILDAIGVSSVSIVPEQAEPDGDFQTCPYPNPEVREALSLGLRMCDRVHPDLLLATDPDADRVGIAISHNETYELLSGNEVGILLLDFLARKSLECNIDLGDKVAMTTIVSAPMADDLALAYGFELRRTLTGFKFIGEQVGTLDAEGLADCFLFGFEESYGYLSGSYVRDKDAVVASMLLCELTAWWKARGLDLYDVMHNLYEKYGFWNNELLSVVYEGPDGAEKMSEIMAGLRRSNPLGIAGIAIEQVIDYSDGVEMPVINAPMNANKQILPASDVLEFRLTGGSRVIIRPSGTEPKIKAYVFAKSANEQESTALVQALSHGTMLLLRI